VAWLLASACLLHHLTHWLGAAAPSWLHLLASTPVHASLAALALLGEFSLRGCLLVHHSFRKWQSAGAAFVASSLLPRLAG
jgi:hypothetical protein